MLSAVTTHLGTNQSNLKGIRFLMNCVSASANATSG